MDKKTIAQWAKEYGVVILDMDGFGGAKRQEHRLTRTEFEQGLAECTILRWPQDGLGSAGGETAATEPAINQTHPEVVAGSTMTPVATPVSTVADLQESIFELPDGDHENGGAQGEKENNPAERRPRTRHAAILPAIPWRRLGWLFLVIPLPALTTLLVHLLYRAVARWFHWHGYFSGGLLAADVFVLWLQPVAPWLSGPGYPYYVVVNMVTQVLHGSYVYVLHQVLHQPFLPPATATVLQSVSVNGVPLPLYFTVDKAVISSLWLATLIISVGDLTGRGLKRVKSHFVR